MTKEEIRSNIEKLSELRSKYSCFDEEEEPFYYALSLGIKGIRALEQEPSEDCVSRKAVIDVLTRNGVHFCDMVKITSDLKELPSAIPKPKMGHWIADVDKWGDVVTTVNGYKCSECGGFNADNDKYCPNCGADMRGDK